MCAIGLAMALSRFFPVVAFIAALQERVMSWGAWAAICYPLLFAACNVLLLPGGILAVGGGFFFGLWWGFLIVFAGNIVATANSVPAQAEHNDRQEERQHGGQWACGMGSVQAVNNSP